MERLEGMCHLCKPWDGFGRLAGGEGAQGVQILGAGCDEGEEVLAKLPGVLRGGVVCRELSRKGRRTLFLYYDTLHSTSELSYIVIHFNVT